MTVTNIEFSVEPAPETPQTIMSRALRRGLTPQDAERIIALSIDDLTNRRTFVNGSSLPTIIGNAFNAAVKDMMIEVIKRDQTLQIRIAEWVRDAAMQAAMQDGDLRNSIAAAIGDYWQSVYNSNDD